MRTRRRRLQQVLVNLLGNAIKFTDSGEVLLRVEMQGEPGRSSRIAFAIEDIGCRIPEHQLHTIFELFSQGDSSLTRKASGAG